MRDVTETPRPTRSLREALEAEHREIDADIESFAASITTAGGDDTQLKRALDALRRHIYVEEELLFPALSGAGQVGPILVMVREHAQMWHTLDALERLLATEPRSDECLTATCNDLFEQLQRHNPKEELILYPQADEVLAAGELARLREFLASGDLPTGWVCQGMPR